MTSTRFLVVGAGPTGLGCATALAAYAPVTVIERIPVTGGTAGWDDPDVATFTQAVRKSDVRLLLGETALRWDGTHLLVAGPGTIRRLPGTHLFFAGGLRPAAAADLSIDGDRPAGIVPATVAEHLLQSGVKLWNTAVVLGNGPWAHHVGLACRKLGTRVIAVAESDNVEPPAWADEHHPRPDTITVVGRERVSTLRMRTPAGELDVPCDGVVLAAAPRPSRNVDGALLDGDAGVTFLQPIRPHRPLDRYNAGRAVAQAWLDTNGDLR
jgi:NADPH-dependent 2,4-dienoyl-CoA reductase/sulfur reductase-like enzyme